MNFVTYAERQQMALVMLKSGLADVTEVARRVDMSERAVQRLADRHGVIARGAPHSIESVVRSPWQG